MAKQTKTPQRIFGLNASTDEFGIIGSDSEGNPQFSKDLGQIQSLDSFLSGLYGITSDGQEPPRIQDINALYFLLTSQLLYNQQVGIPEWDAASEYYADVSIVQVAGVVYVSMYGTDGTPNVNHNPTTDDGTYWKAFILNDYQIGKNKIINGNFDIWQRGTSVLISTAGTASSYQADRWIGVVGGTNASTTYSRQSFSIGQSDVPGNPKYFMRSLCTNGGDSTNGANYFKQCIEDVRTLAGKTVTLSFYAKADVAKNIAIQIYQNFGTGGSPSSGVSTHIIKFAITDTWAKYTATFDVPSIIGKTLGTTEFTSSIHLIIWMSAGTTYNTQTGTLGIQTGTFDIARVQLEEGSIATKFEERPISIEPALCKRYYIHNSTAAAVVSFAADTTVAYCVPHIRMRISPTVTHSSGVFSKPGTGNFNITSLGTAPGANGAIVGSATIATGAGTGCPGQISNLQFDAEF